MGNEVIVTKGASLVNENESREFLTGTPGVRLALACSGVLGGGAAMATRVGLGSGSSARDWEFVGDVWAMGESAGSAVVRESDVWASIHETLLRDERLPTQKIGCDYRPASEMAD